MIPPFTLGLEVSILMYVARDVVYKPTLIALTLILIIMPILGFAIFTFVLTSLPLYLTIHLIILSLYILMIYKIALISGVNVKPHIALFLITISIWFLYKLSLVVYLTLNPPKRAEFTLFALKPPMLILTALTVAVLPLLAYYAYKYVGRTLATLITVMILVILVGWLLTYLEVVKHMKIPEAWEIPVIQLPLLLLEASTYSTLLNMLVLMYYLMLIELTSAFNDPFTLPILSSYSVIAIASLLSATYKLYRESGIAWFKYFIILALANMISDLVGLTAAASLVPFAFSREAPGLPLSLAMTIAFFITASIMTAKYATLTKGVLDLYQPEGRERAQHTVHLRANVISHVVLNIARFLGIMGSLVLLVSVVLITVSRAPLSPPSLPLLGILTHLASLTLILVPLYIFSRVYGEKRIFVYALISIALLIGDIFLVPRLIAILARILSEVFVETPIGIPPTLLRIPSALLILLSAFLWYKSMNILSKKSSTELFKLHGLLVVIARVLSLAYVIGPLTVVELLSLLTSRLTLFISSILLTLAFYLLKPPQPPTLQTTPVNEKFLDIHRSYPELVVELARLLMSISTSTNTRPTRSYVAVVT